MTKKEYYRKWCIENKDKVKSYNEKWRAKNRMQLREYNKEWRKNNPIKDRARSRRTPHRFFKSLDSAKRRGLSWSISLEQFTELLAQPCFYSPNHIKGETGSGLDRIDNMKGYITGNVLPCCAKCNRSRGDRYTVEQWSIMISALENFNNNLLLNNT